VRDQTEKRKLPWLQLSSKRSLLIARLAEFIDRFSSEDIHSFFAELFDMVLQEAPAYLSSHLNVASLVVDTLAFLFLGARLSQPFLSR
jgi:hypothetical protein